MTLLRAAFRATCEQPRESIRQGEHEDALAAYDRGERPPEPRG